jgi:hypothetical protein
VATPTVIEVSSIANGKQMVLDILSSDLRRRTTSIAQSDRSNKVRLRCPEGDCRYRQIPVR